MEEGEGECAVCLELIVDQHVYMCPGCSASIVCLPCKNKLQHKGGQNAKCVSCRQKPIKYFIRNRLAEQRFQRIEKEKAQFDAHKQELESLTVQIEVYREEIERLQKLVEKGRDQRNQIRAQKY